ncbi:MAG: toprim domain-containing protein [Candidatus Saccharimonadales bacterium]
MSKHDEYLALASERYHDQFVARENVGHWAVSAGRNYLARHGLRTPYQCRDGRWLVNKYQFGVVINPLSEDKRFEGWLCIPYMTELGCRAIRFRNLKDEGPKIGQHKGQRVRIYNPDAYFQADQVIGIAEGEIDAIAATEGLGLPTVGIPGSTQWGKKANIWKPTFKNYQRVLILADGDTDGKKLAEIIVESLGHKAKVIKMPAGEDVSSMLVQGRASQLTKQFKD